MTLWEMRRVNTGRHEMACEASSVAADLSKKFKKITPSKQMSLNQQALQEEERIFQQEVQAVRNWFKKDRFALVTRPYTAEEGTLLPGFH